MFSKSKSIYHYVFFLEFWNLLSLKISKYYGHPSIQPKKNLFGIRKRCTTRLSFCYYLWPTSTGRIVGIIFFLNFIHFSTAPVFFLYSFLDPKLSLALLPPSLCVKSSHLSCPALVAAAWHQHNEAPAQQGALPCLWTDFFLSQGFFFHISHVIPCSPEEHHPLLLLRRKKKKSVCLLVELILSKTEVISWEALGFHITLIFSRCFPQLTMAPLVPQTAEIVLGFPKMRELFLGDHGNFDILPETKGQGFIWAVRHWREQRLQMLNGTCRSNLGETWHWLAKLC